MPAENKLELVIQVDADKANASIKTVNTTLSGLESTAVSAAKGASQGIDGMTASIVKGATAGTLLADPFKEALSFVKEIAMESVKAAAHEERLAAAGISLAKANGI